MIRESAHGAAEVLMELQVLDAVVLTRELSEHGFDELLLIASATSPQDWTNRMCYLPL